MDEKARGSKKNTHTHTHNDKFQERDEQIV